MKISRIKFVVAAGERGDRWLLNVQPVIPIALNKDWNVISRTIVPIVNQKDVSALGVRDTGFGDVVQSFFLPVQPTASGWIWGVCSCSRFLATQQSLQRPLR